MKAQEMKDRGNREQVAARLVVAWRRSGLTVQQLCDETGLNQTTVHRYLTGERFVSGWGLQLLCPVLGCTSDFVLGIEPERGFETEIAPQEVYEDYE